MNMTPELEAQLRRLTKDDDCYIYLDGTVAWNDQYNECLSFMVDLHAAYAKSQQPKPTPMTTLTDEYIASQTPETLAFARDVVEYAHASWVRYDVLLSRLTPKPPTPLTFEEWCNSPADSAYTSRNAEVIPMTSAMFVFNTLQQLFDLGPWFRNAEDARAYDKWVKEGGK